MQKKTALLYLCGKKGQLARPPRGRPLETMSLLMGQLIGLPIGSLTWCGKGGGANHGCRISVLILWPFVARAAGVVIECGLFPSTVCSSLFVVLLYFFFVHTWSAACAQRLRACSQSVAICVFVFRVYKPSITKSVVCGGSVATCGSSALVVPNFSGVQTVHNEIRCVRRLGRYVRLVCPCCPHSLLCFQSFYFSSYFTIPLHNKHMKTTDEGATTRNASIEGVLRTISSKASSTLPPKNCSSLRHPWMVKRGQPLAPVCIGHVSEVYNLRESV